MHWQRFQMKGGGGGGEGVSWAKTDTKLELNRLAISRGFSAEDLNGVRLPGSANALADIRRRDSIRNCMRFGIRLQCRPKTL